MSVLQAVVLGAVQGLTEFIPISSSGHLVLVPEALGWDQQGLTFDVLLHAASLVALLVYFWRDYTEVVVGTVRGRPGARKIALLLVVGTIPAVVAGLAFERQFAESFEQARPAAVRLGITAAILVAAELAFRYHKRRVNRSGAELRRIDDLNAGDATVIGIAQAVSILPGISRSGSTIGAGLALAAARDDAAKFSFLLAIPALIGATILELPELGGTSPGLGAGLAGFLSSLVFSYAAIAGLIRYLRRNNLYPFAAYCIVAAVIFYVIV